MERAVVQDARNRILIGRFDRRSVLAGIVQGGTKFHANHFEKLVLARLKRLIPTKDGEYTHLLLLPHQRSDEAHSLSSIGETLGKGKRPTVREVDLRIEGGQELLIPVEGTA